MVVPERAVQHMPCNQEVTCSNPTRCWAFDLLVSFPTFNLSKENFILTHIELMGGILIRRRWHARKMNSLFIHWKCLNPLLVDIIVASSFAGTTASAAYNGNLIVNKTSNCSPYCGWMCKSYKWVVVPSGNWIPFHYHNPY